MLRISETQFTIRSAVDSVQPNVYFDRYTTVSKFVAAVKKNVSDVTRFGANAPTGAFTVSILSPETDLSSSPTKCYIVSQSSRVSHKLLSSHHLSRDNHSVHAFNRGETT